MSESASVPVLHHYKISPFSEKVRLVLGYKGLPWRSVNVPNILPKPDVLAPNPHKHAREHAARPHGAGAAP
jgi:glutathione S-transferase